MGLNILALKILVHSGHEIAGSPQEALMAAFTETDIVFRRELEMQRSQKKGTSGAQWHPGCTATTALLTGNKLFVANAGDCRTVLCRNGKAIQLSKDHTASCIEERERIISAGGHVSWQVDTWRVGAAALEVTRSIGDDDLKPFVTAEPELQECVLSADDEFLVGEIN
jgi:serine/threonine protein phosphatase PrpC